MSKSTSFVCEACNKEIIGGRRNPTVNGKKLVTCVPCSVEISLNKTRENSRKRQGFNSISKKVISSRGSRCEKCGSDQNLEAHHLTRLMDGGTNEENNLIVLCHVCHRKEHEHGTWR